MKLNDVIIDPEGREARIVTMPIPEKGEKMAVVLYADGRGRLVDLAKCQVTKEKTS